MDVKYNKQTLNSSMLILLSHAIADFCFGDTLRMNDYHYGPIPVFFFKYGTEQHISRKPLQLTEIPKKTTTKP